MSQQIPPSKCESCGAVIPPDAPAGFCPSCFAEAATEKISDGSGSAVGKFVTPSPDELDGKMPGIRIEALLGHGGMGAVYLGRQKELDRLVAVKVLPLELTEKDPAFAERFRREARAMAKLSHPNIVSVHDFGCTEDGRWYIVMEYVDGADLHQMIRSGGCSPSEALALVPQICEGLQYAHDQGVIHRDIKPGNILVDRTGRVKITDFGLAKLFGADASQFSLTLEGTALGTPHYMAPEQLDPQGHPDHRADIFSLGVVFYELLTGELPRGAFAPPSKNKQDIDARLDEVVSRAMQTKPEARYQHASEIKTEVDGIRTPRAVYEEGSPPEVKGAGFKWVIVVTSIVLLAAVASIFTFFVGSDKQDGGKESESQPVDPKLVVGIWKDSKTDCYTQFFADGRCVVEGVERETMSPELGEGEEPLVVSVEMYLRGHSKWSINGSEIEYTEVVLDELEIRDVEVVNGGGRNEILLELLVNQMKEEMNSRSLSDFSVDTVRSEILELSSSTLREKEVESGETTTHYRVNEWPKDSLNNSVVPEAIVGVWQSEEGKTTVTFFDDGRFEADWRLKDEVETESHGFKMKLGYDLSVVQRGKWSLEGAKLTAESDGENEIIHNSPIKLDAPELEKIFDKEEIEKQRVEMEKSHVEKFMPIFGKYKIIDEGTIQNLTKTGFDLKSGGDVVKFKRAKDGWLARSPDSNDTGSLIAGKWECSFPGSVIAVTFEPSGRYRAELRQAGEQKSELKGEAVTYNYDYSLRDQGGWAVDGLELDIDSDEGASAIHNTPLKIDPPGIVDEEGLKDIEERFLRELLKANEGQGVLADGTLKEISEKEFRIDLNGHEYRFVRVAEGE